MYTKEGPGVRKDQPPKKGIPRFFEILMRDYGHLLKVNFLFLLCCLPMVTVVLFGLLFHQYLGMLLIAAVLYLLCAVLVGPAMTCLHGITVKTVRDEPCYMWHEFKKCWKGNWKQSVPAGVLFCTLLAMECIAAWYYMFMQSEMNVLLVDGVDVRLWDLQALRRRIGMATQRVQLYSDTVSSNIAYSAPDDISEDDVALYARLAAADFICSLPEGFDTIIGEQGTGLSGGQKQRIALARALAKQPEILILDDTTSAVDLETEKQLRKNLQELPYPCTKIIVAQRISAVRSADQILVLQDGRIAQRGTHEQLAACEGYYRDICLLQGVQGMPDAPAANAPAKEVR